ncbi:MAG: hypothetical protein Q9O62_08595 [Ardenticatenia bacterium]|nr:hypothetical protein [Ardenticatenia bacterium]
MSPAVRACVGWCAAGPDRLGGRAGTGRLRPHCRPRELFVSPTGAGTACTRAAPCTLATALGLAADGDTLYLA